MRLRSVVRRNTSPLVSVATGTIVLVALIELVLRIASAMDWVSLPSMAFRGFDPTHVSRDAPREQRLFEDDLALLFSMRPNFHRVYSKMAVIAGEERNYTIDTEAHGFRTPPFSEHKRPGVFRIACLGDSSTFGMNVNESDAYPRLLAAQLEEKYPGRFEVINLGVPGYTTRQGLELLRRRALQFEPDLVTFGFGTNDRFFSQPIDDDGLIRFNQTLGGAALFRARQAFDNLFLYRLAQRAVSAFAHTSVTEIAPTKRVSLQGVRDNVVAAHHGRRPHDRRPVGHLPARGQAVGQRRSRVPEHGDRRGRRQPVRGRRFET